MGIYVAGTCVAKLVQLKSLSGYLFNVALKHVLTRAITEDDEYPQINCLTAVNFRNKGKKLPQNKSNYSANDMHN